MFRHIFSEFDSFWTIFILAPCIIDVNIKKIIFLFFLHLTADFYFLILQISKKFSNNRENQEIK